MISCKENLETDTQKKKKLWIKISYKKHNYVQTNKT